VPAARRWRSRVLPWCGQRDCLGHRLAAEAAAVIDPAPGIKPRLGENRLAAGEEVVDPTGDPLVCARRAVIGHAVALLDGSEPDDFSELADRLEQGAAAGAEIADRQVYMTVESRKANLLSMRQDGTPGWSFLTNHGQVLLCIAHDPGIRLREIGEAVGITERAAHRIVVELAAAGYISRERNGRRNHYTIQSHLPLPDPLARGQKVGDLLAILAGQPTEASG
jgi:hypothetical protein